MGSEFSEGIQVEDRIYIYIELGQVKMETGTAVRQMLAKKS